VSITGHGGHQTKTSAYAIVQLPRFPPVPESESIGVEVVGSDSGTLEGVPVEKRVAKKSICVSVKTESGGGGAVLLQGDAKLP